MRDFRTTLGASEIAAVLGADPYRTPDDVWRQKVLGERTEDNPHMLRGRCLEPGILTWWEAITGQTLRRNARTDGRDPRQTDVLHANGWAAATLDGYCEAARLVVEAKAPMASKKWSKAGEHPLHYRVQVIWQIGVARSSGLAADAGELIAGPMYGELWRYPIEFDAELFDLALRRGAEFMEFVKAGAPLPASFNGTTEAA